MPFNTPKADQRVVLAVVERVADLGFSSITLGGGDPFQYPFIRGVIMLAKMQGLNVHVDTHGRSLTPTILNAEVMTTSVDLLGLPLDGPNAAIHDSMRGSLGHFDLVLRRFAWLQSLGVTVKINTMISGQNLGELTALAMLVHRLAPSRWSIYQFWPLGPAGEVSLIHSVDQSSFISFARDAKRLVEGNGVTAVEISEERDRHTTYPLIYHDGSVQVHSHDDLNAIITICSIFDESARAIIDDYCKSERLQAASRYGPSPKV